MKVRLIHLLLLFISCNFSAQEKYCNCEKFESLVDCKKHIFSNAASIHWEYNCDKGKIIFENKKVKKKLFEIETDFMDRIGYQFANEYENKFLFNMDRYMELFLPKEDFCYQQGNGIRKKFI